MTPPQKRKIFPGSTRLIYDEVEYGLMLLTGPPGVGKTTLCKQSVFDSLTDGNSVVYLTTEESPDRIIESMVKFGWPVSDYVASDKLRIIDAFSPRGSTPTASKYRVDQPENLTNVSLMIEKAREGVSSVVFVLDSVTRLILNAGTEWGQKFMQSIASKLQATKALGLCVFDVGILDEAFLNFMRFIFDGVIEMQLKESGEAGELRRLIRIYSLKLGRHDTSWHEFQITSKGIDIL